MAESFDGGFPAGLGLDGLGTTQPVGMESLYDHSSRAFGQAERKDGPRMIKVKARGNESIDQMLKRFKKMCEKEGLTKDIKRNSYYEKPSERRRRRMRKAVKRAASE